ncbi:MAG: UDP-2,3-diacylglucosamine diphosphatase [Hyphomicrobiales bacterium]
MENKELNTKRKKVYFISDIHLGVPDHKRSLEREKKLVRWLDYIKKDALEVFLMGDVFDFWFEYKTVVPKGYIRFLGKLAELVDAGIPVHLFRGNHDIWAFDYFKKEIGVELHRKPIIKEFYGKKFYLAHGDGLGPGDTGYKIMKKIFELKFNQWLFKWLHPDIGTRMGLYFSERSRIANVAATGFFSNNVPLEKEMLYIYSNEVLKEEKDINYFIYGHRHIVVNHELKPNSSLIILGDWITHFSYGVFDGEKFEVLKFDR